MVTATSPFQAATVPETLLRVCTHRQPPLDPPGPGRRPWLPAGLVARLAAHDWPGNVRELRNVVRQLVIASRGFDQIRLHPSIERLLHAAPATSDQTAREPAPPVPTMKRPRRAPAEIREQELTEALRTHRYRLQATAEALGISRASLYDLIKKSPNVRKASDLSRQEIEACHTRWEGHVEKMAEELEVSEAALKRRMGQLGWGRA